MADTKQTLTTSIEQVGALIKPKNIVLVGASDRPGSWPATVWKTVHEHGFKGNIYAINPNRSSVGDKPCYPDFASLPEKPDHVAFLTPAKHVPGALAQAAAAGARSATVFASGFGEDGDPHGLELAEELRRVIKQTGIGVTGPNCTGNIIAESGLVTLVDHRKLNVAPGKVSLVGQSGGVLLYANHILADRGIQIGKLITSGNEAGLNCADYIAYLAQDDATSVIFCYLEAIKELDKFKAACALARRNGKPVIIFKIGASEEGRKAAMTHTGALAGSSAVFDAVLEDVGVLRANSLDEVVEMIELVVHLGVPIGPNIGAMSLSGAYRGILVDAASGSGMTFPALAPDVEKRLTELLGVGSSAGNPTDGGFTVLTSVEKYIEAVDIFCDDPNLDILVLQAELPREEGMAANWEERFQGIHDLVTRRGKKLAFISMFSRMYTDYTRKLRADLPNIAFIHETTKSISALARLAEWSRRASEAADASKTSGGQTRDPLPVAVELKARANEASGTFLLNERASKQLLAAYGMSVTREEIAASADDAVRLAEDIGYPVVLKAVSDRLYHKSDIGAVQLHLGDADAVRAAYQLIHENVARSGFDGELDGILVCQQIDGGVELVAGIQRDPEMGPVLMVGSGGILLELMQDVAFSALPLDRDRAIELVKSTRINKLLGGYRGDAAHDLDRIADALVALSNLAVDLGDSLESIDINPLMSRAGTNDPIALDAVVVLGREGSH
ncbi:MAG: acetate--CoA ligase family protein [Rhizobiaceae bacterium]